jgi:hypothetical protein
VKHSNIININCFYAGSVHPSSNVWRWDNCDKLLAFADNNPTWKKRAHVAFWPFNSSASLNLQWLLTGSDGKTVSREQAIVLLRDHITTMMTKYKGRFHYWDVVNEAVDYTQSDGIRAGLWKEVIGSDLVEVAFTIAREADPSAKLFYNDFNEWVPAKREAIYALVKKLKDKGLIDGIGLQQHVGMTSPTIALVDTAISRYAELGLEIHVTELDVEVNPGEPIFAEPLERLAAVAALLGARLLARRLVVRVVVGDQVGHRLLLGRSDIGHHRRHRLVELGKRGGLGVGRRFGGAGGHCFGIDVGDHRRRRTEQNLGGPEKRPPLLGRRDRAAEQGDRQGHRRLTPASRVPRCSSGLPA